MGEEGVVVVVVVVAGISKYASPPSMRDRRKNGQSVVRRVRDSRASAREISVLEDLRTTWATSERGRARLFAAEEGEGGRPEAEEEVREQEEEEEAVKSLVHARRREERGARGEGGEGGGG